MTTIAIHSRSPFGALSYGSADIVDYRFEGSADQLLHIVASILYS